MADTVALPVWALVLLGALAAWAAFDKLLVPALRWMVTSPANRVIDEL